MLTHIVGASDWGRRGRANMRQHPQSLALQLIGRAAANRGRGRCRRAHGPLDFGKVLGYGTAPTLPGRAARSTAPNRDSGGVLVAAALRGPGPWQQLVKLLHGPAVDELCEDIGQIGLRVESIELGCLNQRRDASPVKCPLVMTGEQAVLFSMDMFP